MLDMSKIVYIANFIPTGLGKYHDCYNQYNIIGIICISVYTTYVMYNNIMFASLNNFMIHGMGITINSLYACLLEFGSEPY